MPTTYRQIKNMNWTYGDLKRFSYATLKTFFDNLVIPVTHSITNEREETHLAGHQETTHYIPSGEDISHA